MRDIEPGDVFHGAAFIADEVVMPVKVGIVAGGLSVKREFADETGFDEGVKGVVNGGAGRPCVAFVQRHPKLIDGGVFRARHQMFEDNETLRSLAYAGPFERFLNMYSRHRSKLRLDSNTVPDPLHLWSGMKIAPARQAAFAALLAIERGAWSAEALAIKSAHLDPRDAGLASDIVFGTLRHMGEIDHIIGQCSKRPMAEVDPAVHFALAIGIYQMRFLDRVPGYAAVNDSVELVHRAGQSAVAPFVNAVLRRVGRENIGAPEIASTPAWLYKRWVAEYGAETAAGIARASLAVPERYIRVGKAEPPAGADPTEVEGCYVLPAGDPGPFRFQDIGSQAVVPLLELQPGQSYLDVCAAPGNKTAQALETAVRAVACDVHLSRARMLLSLAADVVVLDGTGPLPFSRLFDRILVDAPCTGTGTLSRNPEIKWRLSRADIRDLRERQTAILKNALKQLAPEGLLVYSTCSLEHEENQDVVAASGATVVRTMQRTPGRDPGDGFFAAVLRIHGV